MVLLFLTVELCSKQKLYTTDLPGEKRPKLSPKGRHFWPPSLDFNCFSVFSVENRRKTIEVTCILRSFSSKKKKFSYSSAMEAEARLIM